MKKIRSFVLISLFLAIGASVFAAPKIEIERVEPLNWWVGMKNPKVQVLVYGAGISGCDVNINYPGVKLNSVVKVKSPNYLFLNLEVASDAKPGDVKIDFRQQGTTVATYNYQLMARENGSDQRVGFNSSDAVYLLMPDRFANGNPNNDDAQGYLEKSNRKEPFGRHGGDIQGISDHLDYITNLGFTALWFTPVLENNLERSSYHGYAITNFYSVDKRLGTNEEFKALTQKCKAVGVKMIMDMVFNHCGINHWWMKDLPTEDWINQWPTYTNSYYRLSTVSDPNGSIADRDVTVKGWFDRPMPDLNLQNELLVTYLSQNAIWWIEYAGLQGIRVDTYPYPDRIGMSKWGEAVLNEFPNFNIVGECWISSSAKTAFYQSGFPHKDGFDSHLPSVMDFPLRDVISRSLSEEKAGWGEGMIRIYDVLAEDFLYANPNNIMVFPDNHDMTRIFTELKGDKDALKMAIALVSTMRGYPQFYYGTELMFEGDGGNHSTLRIDVPGGWAGDKVNAFTAQGRTADQNEIYNYMSKLLNYRKNEPVLHNGKFTQFLPFDNIYLYARSSENKTVVVVMNNNRKGDAKVETARFAEVMSGFTKGVNVITGESLTDLKTLIVPQKSALIIELTK